MATGSTLIESLSQTANPTILVCTLLCSLALLLFWIRSAGRSRLPPSPWRLPIIGNLHQLTDLPHKGLYALSQKYGPIMLMRFGSVPFCVISSGELAREVTKTHDAVFSDRAATKASRMLFPGGDDLLFAPENKFWRLTKKLCVSELLNVRRVQSFQTIRVEEVARMVETIRSSNRCEIDLSNLFLQLSSAVFSRVVLGVTGKNDVKGSLSVQGIQAISEISSFEDFVPALSWVDRLTGLHTRLQKTSQSIHAFLDQIIEHRAEILRSGNGGDEAQRSDEKCFVDIILELKQKDMIDLNLTHSDIRSILVDMFIAGLGAYAMIMEWAMTLLAKNPKMMKRVQDEVRGIVGRKSEIHKQDTDRMEYMKCVIKETLRLHAPALTVRQASRAVTVGGFELPAKVTALINIYAIHRDPKAWVRPLEFLPERFMNTSYNFKGQDEVYFPFGMGRRICPGIDLAVAELDYALANVLCWFDWELPEGVAPDDIDMRGTSSVTSRKLLPLRLVPVAIPTPPPST
uniref:Cytochrome P450 n=1 Tax=Kalanchoe fedtschenkoi TaxID=63787 RepID=A0A7N0RGR4_KALFE